MNLVMLSISKKMIKWGLRWFGFALLIQRAQEDNVGWVDVDALMQLVLRGRGMNMKNAMEDFPSVWNAWFRQAKYKFQTLFGGGNLTLINFHHQTKFGI